MLHISVELILSQETSFPPVISNDGLETRLMPKRTNLSGTGGVVSTVTPSDTTVEDVQPTPSTAYTL